MMGRALYWAHRFVQWLGGFSRPRPRHVNKHWAEQGRPVRAREDVQ